MEIAMFWIDMLKQEDGLCMKVVALFASLDLLLDYSIVKKDIFGWTKIDGHQRSRD